jgi:branched-chain amino acid transport system ATP-binding protein
MLDVTDLVAGYGSIRALDGVTIHVPRGKIVALFGSNGAGKTTLMHTIAGLMHPMRGTIAFDGTRIGNEPAHRIFERGVVLVPQGRQLFPEMSVRENLELGGLSALAPGEIASRIDDILGVFPRLRERIDQRAAGLSGGEQQMLATGRALMSSPRLLLLDEPTTGLAPLVVAEITRILQTLKDAGQTILIVEQNVRMALELADQVYVMRVGKIVHEAPASAVRERQDMFSSYFS